MGFGGHRENVSGIIRSDVYWARLGSLKFNYVIHKLPIRHIDRVHVYSGAVGVATVAHIYNDSRL